MAQREPHVISKNRSTIVMGEMQNCAGRLFAIVGPTGAGKSTLMRQLQKELHGEKCVFLSDSRGEEENNPLARYTRRVTQFIHEGVSEETPPDVSMPIFWSRLASIIKASIVPNIKSGVDVYIDGFGGTILAHALYAAKSDSERDHLIKIHKSFIELYVIDAGLRPPTYFWLKPNPDIAYQRLKTINKTPRCEMTLEYIKKLNEGYEFYGNLPGQTVIPIDADKTNEEVLKHVLAHISSPSYNREITV